MPELVDRNPVLLPMQVFFNIFGETFELGILGCEGFPVSSWATGLFKVVDEAPLKRVSGTGVFE